MSKDVSRMATVLPGKGVLILIAVTAVTAGFSLGYFVGRSVPPSLDPSLPTHSAAHDPALVPPLPNPSSELTHEASSPSMPRMQPSPPQGTHASAPSSLPGATSPVSDMKHEEKLNPKSLRTAVTEKRVSPDGGEQSASPAGASNPDRGTKNTSDLPGTVKGTSAPSADPSHGKSVYTVQAAAFKLQKDADALKQSLENKGYKVFIKKEPNPKGVVLYKVRVGEFGQKKDASVFALKLKKTDGLNAFAVIKN